VFFRNEQTPRCRSPGPENDFRRVSVLLWVDADDTSRVDEVGLRRIGDIFLETLHERTGTDCSCCGDFGRRETGSHLSNFFSISQSGRYS